MIHDIVQESLSDFLCLCDGSLVDGDLVAGVGVQRVSVNGGFSVEVFEEGGKGSLRGSGSVHSV